MQASNVRTGVILTLAAAAVLPAPGRVFGDAAKPSVRASSHTVLHDQAAEFARGRITSGQIQAQPAGVLLVCPLEPGAVLSASAEFESPIIDAARFNEALISCNVDTPPNGAFCVELRVGRHQDGSWSPYLYVFDWGRIPTRQSRVTEFAHGRIATDYFTSTHAFDRLQYRIRACATPPTESGGADRVALRIRQVAICLSNTLDPGGDKKPAPQEPSSWPARLPVPFRSQKTDRPELAGRLCNAASLAMLLAYYEIDVPALDVADRVRDPLHDIYGNWPRSIQTAYSYGLPGHLTRISDWGKVADSLTRRRPLVISVKAERGQLAGARYSATEGHLMVLAGFDGDERVAVNDPAYRSATEGQCAYRRQDLEAVWLQARSGTAYIFTRPSVQPAPGTPADLTAEGLIELLTVDPRIMTDLPYATANNFTGTRLYDAARCLLRESVARRLARVQDRLVRQGLGLKVYDAYRPLSVQRKLWALVPDPQYVANPEKGSRHNRGAAVDVTLVDHQGREQEMPTPFDTFGPAAHRDHDGHSATARQNLAILTEAMQAEGFEPLASEWWHFDAPGWEAYPLLDVPLGNTSRSAATRSS